MQVRPAQALVVVGALLLLGALASATMLHAAVLPVRDAAGHVVGTIPNPTYVHSRWITWTLTGAGSALVACAGVLRLRRRSVSRAG